MVEDDTARRLLDRLRQDVTPEAWQALAACEAACRSRGAGAYLVGGAVRDLMLGRENIDLDLAIEGSVQPVAEALERELNARVVRHERFGTATLRGAGFHLDLAQTRRETYAHPGALPAVEPVESIHDDLSRRDFTINAMALQLAPARLIDPFGGVSDLRAGLVRVLHEASFQDDATRMLRAARYAARLGFRLEPESEGWLRRDLAFLDAISGPRLRRELELVFREEKAPDAIALASRLGILTAIHSGLRFDARIEERWRAALAQRHYAPVDELGFCLIADHLTAEAAEALAGRLHLTARQRRALTDVVRLHDLSDKLDSAFDQPSRVTGLLDGYAKASIWALTVLEADGAPACRRYLETWQHVRPHLSGNDLLSLGVPPGETIGAMLRRLRAARLDGEVFGREDEIRLVEAVLGAKGERDGEGS